MDSTDHRSATTVVLGAGASRSVSYAHKGGYPSPLDTDFFDLLQRLEPTKEDHRSVSSVLAKVRLLPHEYWRSMERAFYTLHLRAFIAEKLTGTIQKPKASDIITGDFARCVQSLLRNAHGTKVCENHTGLLEVLQRGDTVVSFNYDLVAERAIRGFAEKRGVGFGPHLYGLDKVQTESDIPLILKLHGSSNWRPPTKEGMIEVRTKSWDGFNDSPGYRGHLGKGSVFPIFLPFWDKRIEDEPWLAVWQTALGRLQATKQLIVWGYSLPQTDVKAQELVTLGLAKAPIDLCVIDPSLITRSRWRDLLPKARYWEYENVKDFLSEPPLWWEMMMGEANTRTIQPAFVQEEAG